MDGEFAWISELANRFGQGQLDDSLFGIGDDAAVFTMGSGAGSPESSIVISVDAQVEDIHFRRDWIGFHALGRRLVHVGFSDIAAMGAQPWTALVTVEAGSDVSPDDRCRFTDGIAEATAELGVRLIGGNVSGRIRGFSAHVVAIGRMRNGRPLLRSGATAGEEIYVTGKLGSAAVARMLLEQPKSQVSADLSDAYLKPRAHWEIGMMLAESGVVGAMIDISDGMAADLQHLCLASNVSAVLNSEDLPIDNAVREWCAAHEIDPVEFVLSGGEDYVLLFTVKSSAAIEGSLRERLVGMGEQVHRVGCTESGNGISLLRDGLTKTLHPEGFDHFLRRAE